MPGKAKRARRQASNASRRRLGVSSTTKRAKRKRAKGRPRTKYKLTRSGRMKRVGK